MPLGGAVGLQHRLGRRRRRPRRIGAGPRVFLCGDAVRSLVTNWSVHSQSARDLTTDLFRRQNADQTLSRGEALRQAMMALMDGRGFVGADGKTIFAYAHPLFWAPYTSLAMAASDNSSVMNRGKSIQSPINSRWMASAPIFAKRYPSSRWSRGELIRQSFETHVRSLATFRDVKTATVCRLSRANPIDAHRGGFDADFGLGPVSFENLLERVPPRRPHWRHDQS